MDILTMLREQKRRDKPALTIISLLTAAIMLFAFPPAANASGIYDSRCQGNPITEDIYVWTTKHGTLVRLHCGVGGSQGPWGYRHISDKHGYSSNAHQRVGETFRYGVRRQKVNDASRKVWVYYRAGGCWIVPVENDNLHGSHHIGVVTAFFSPDLHYCDRAHI